MCLSHKKVFSHLDYDEDDVVTMEEVVGLLEMFGLSADDIPQEAIAAVSAADTNGDGGLDLEGTYTLFGLEI